jgi:hypothetical protein
MKTIWSLPMHSVDASLNKLETKFEKDFICIPFDFASKFLDVGKGSMSLTLTISKIPECIAKVTVGNPMQQPHVSVVQFLRSTSLQPPI